MRQEAESTERATIDRKVAGSSRQLAHYPAPFGETGCLWQREEECGCCIRSQWRLSITWTMLVTLSVALAYA